MNLINAAIIGFGTAGRVFHAPILNCIEGINLKKIYINHAEKLSSAQRLYPNADAVTSLEEVFRDQTIDLIVIAAPNASHYTLAMDGINAGKHVVIDKPFTVTSSEADQLIAAAKEQGVVLSAFHNRRWDSDFKTVQKLVRSGLLGNLAECEIHMDRFRNYFKNSWKEDNLPGSGLLYDLGPHMIDQALTLFGSPISITADLRKQRNDAKEIDNFELILHYEMLKVTLKAGMLVKIPSPHFLLLGDKGSFAKYGMDPQEEDLGCGLNPRDKSNWGIESPEWFGTIAAQINGISLEGKIESEPGDYRDYYRNIYHAITQQEALHVTPQQARNTIRLIELAMESNQTKSTVFAEGLL